MGDCGHYNRMETLAPSKWPTEKSGSRRRPPQMQVKAMWHDKDEVPNSWKPEVVLRILIREEPKVRRVLRPAGGILGQHAHHQKNEEVHPAEFSIIKLLFSWKKDARGRRKERARGGAVDRDPTPGLLRSGSTPQPNKEEGEAGEEE